jgi:hypothetical protein
MRLSKPRKLHFLEFKFNALISCLEGGVKVVRERYVESALMT